MKQGGKKVVVIVCILLAVCISCAIYLYIKMRGSTTQMDMKEYYQVSKYKENSIPLIINNQILENKAYEIDGEVYVEQEVASTMIDSLLYWDAIEKMLVIAGPTDITTATINSKVVIVNGENSTEEDKEVVKEVSEGIYAFSLSFIKKYVNVEYKLYDEPRRVVLTSNWGEEVTRIKVTKDDVIRYKGDKDSDILTNAKVGDILYVLQDGVHSFQRYIYVMTKDGIAGYILNKNIGKAYKEVVKNDYQAPEYPTNHLEGKVNLGWMQVSNMAANNNLPNLLDKTSGLNVVCPTWFSVSSVEGDITSLASKNFVNYAHSKGIKVWALVDDFSKTVKLMDVMSNMTSRANLINNLITSTKECGADGINVDFEYIKEESSPHYIQFLRELSIKCRANKLALSVDSYVPLSYNKFYYIDKQGAFVDYVVIMAYDQHHSNSNECGPVAALSYTQTAIDKAMAKVPKEKLIIGVPFYSRLWGEKVDESGQSVIDTVESLDMTEGLNRVVSAGGSFNWDEETMQNYAEYIQNGKTYKIWYEDSKSVAEKVKAIKVADVAGVGYWRIGQETKDVWTAINALNTAN